MGIANISGILSGAGSNISKAFKDLYDLWFDEGSKTQYLKTLEKEGINLARISSILHGAGANVPKAFKELYDFWFDAKGKKTQHLKHFIKKKDGERSFTLYNISGILSKAGAKAKDAFERLHNICFNDEGKRTQLLDDFYGAGFMPSNLSGALFGTGVRASSALERLHSACFNEKGERTELLDDFYQVGFLPGHLCSLLSGATDDLEKFHDFCFKGKAKRYLKHFLNDAESFTLSNLSKILHGAGANIYSAFEDFHDVCFDEKGNKMQLLGDFRNAGFVPSYLSNILSMAGANAPHILRKFNECCFNKENYLNHFLTEKTLFTPKDLSKILYGMDRMLVKKATNAGPKPSNSSERTELEHNLNSLHQSDPRAKRKTRKGSTNRKRRGLYLPSFEARDVKINGKCTAITHGLSQTLLSQGSESFLGNLKISAEIFKHIAQDKRSTGKENRKIRRKRGHSVADKDGTASKRLRMDVNVNSNEDSVFPSNLQDKPGQDKLHNACQTKQYIPHHLIGLMYRLDLSVLCSLKKFTYEHKYPSLSLVFGDSEIDEFNDIVLRYKKKSVHIQIENVDKYYVNSGISYARLFTKEKRSFSINNYFDSFVKHLISKSGSLSNNIEYLIVYTNSGLDLTEKKKLKEG
ncbi:hypothetical protein AVEN_221991-1 [Araneus ventricosus]|uniref:Uncharacterized protein n=1 Tax=Araneus ventricosus TaxID=182803 RepID=A0A4Y2M342_ARAVE|nr:hypothetical protein AVEN_1718-1 [Araneus ventricosus]GBN20984.1 hypothetical protein AVEN_221991-1 [Araneus ventricosus]